jgi:hypothetical protein
MTDHPWRPPVEEALAMADAFREGVPLGYQRAFVTLADAYLDAIADRDLAHETIRLTAATNELSPTPWAAPLHNEPFMYRGEQADAIGQDMIRELRERRANPDTLTPFAYDCDKADRFAQRVLLAALGLAVAVAVLVHFFG